MPRQASSVLEVYTASTLPIATLQVHCPKKLLRLGQYTSAKNSTSSDSLEVYEQCTLQVYWLSLH